MDVIKEVFGDGKDIISNFDKFGSSYSAPKKTKKGAIASLLIHCISFGYFGFLAYQFGTNQLEPTFAFLSQMNFKEHSIELSEYFFGFEYFSELGGSLDDIETASGLVYLLFEVQYYDLNTNQSINIPLVKCTQYDPSISTYSCPDFSQVKGSDGQSLQLTTLRQPQTKVILTAKRCTGLPNCALAADIDTLLSQQSYFDIISFATQYNHVTEKFETAYIQETYFFDITLGINSRINVINAVTNIYNGVLASTKAETSSDPYDFQRQDQYNSQALLALENNQDSLLYLSYELDTFSIKLDVQYPTLMGLVPVAFSLGEIVFVILKIILPNFSKNALSKEVMAASLKGSFAKTAQKLIESSKKEMKEKVDKVMKEGKEEKGDSKENCEEDKKDDGDDDDDGEEKEAINSPNDIFKKVEDYEKQSKDIFNLITKSVGGDWESIFTLFKAILPCLKRKITEKPTQSQEQIKALQKKSSPQQDVNSSIEDILFLKKAIKLLLTKEQYAAIHFCGSDIKEDTSDQASSGESAKSGKTRKNQTSPETLVPMSVICDEKKNHLESIESLETNQTELMNQFKSYIQTSYDQEKQTVISDLDKRILGSLIFDFSPNSSFSPPNKKREKKTQNANGSRSPGLASNLLTVNLLTSPDAFKEIPGLSEITDLLNDDPNIGQPKQ